MKIIEKEFNVKTGEEIITERDETDAEKEARLKRESEKAEQAQAEAEAAAKKAAAEAKLEALGLTKEDLEALGL